MRDLALSVLAHVVVAVGMVGVGFVATYPTHYALMEFKKRRDRVYDEMKRENDEHKKRIAEIQDARL